LYEVINRRPSSAGNATVNIVSGGKSHRSLVLVLASYEPVNWILNLPAGITISKVILVSTPRELKPTNHSDIPFKDLKTVHIVSFQAGILWNSFIVNNIERKYNVHIF